MRKCLGFTYEDLELEAELQKGGGNPRLFVKTDTDIFGPQPFLAIRTKGSVLLG